MFDIPNTKKTEIDLNTELFEDFRTKEDRLQHYQKHIAKDWDDFWYSLDLDSQGHRDIKYPPTVSIETYENKANKIATSDAGISSDHTTPIVGMVVTLNGKDRYVKIKKTSLMINRNNIKMDKVPALCDVVIYTIENGQPLIISMYPSFFSKAIKKMMKIYKDELPENKQGVGEALNESYFNTAILDNVEKVCKEIFPYDFKRVQDKGNGYCGWIFPNGTVLDTEYSAKHFWYEKQVKDVLGDDIDFLKLGLVRYNLDEGLLELPYTPVTREQLNVLDEVFEKHFDKCHFKFGGGGDFRFGDNYRQKAFFIDPNVYEDEYPFDLIYKRDGKEMMQLIRKYCETGKLDERLDTRNAKKQC